MASSTEAGFPKGRVIDDQQGPLFQWDAAAANNSLTLDRLSGSLAAVDRCIIPATHNLEGETVILETSTTGVFGGEETQRFSITATAAIISESFTATQDRHHRIRISTVHQGKIGEVFIGTDRTPVVGPDPKWTDQNVPNLVEVQLRSGLVYRVQASAQRREFDFRFADQAATDLTVFDELESQTSFGLFPFFFFTPESTDPPVYVQLVSPLGREQDRPNPRGLGRSFEIRLQMREILR